MKTKLNIAGKIYDTLTSHLVDLANELGYPNG
jgi:hypothetical protein